MSARFVRDGDASSVACAHAAASNTSACDVCCGPSSGSRDSLPQSWSRAARGSQLHSSRICGAAREIDSVSWLCVVSSWRWRVTRCFLRFEPRAVPPARSSERQRESLPLAALRAPTSALQSKIGYLFFECRSRSSMRFDGLRAPGHGLRRETELPPFVGAARALSFTPKRCVLVIISARN